MRRLWFGLLMIAPACLPARAGAGDVIASTRSQQPLAVNASPAPSPVAPVGYWTPGEQAAAPAVSLGRPVARGAESADIKQIAHTALEPIASPQLSRVPSFLPARSPYQPSLRPESQSVPAPRLPQPMDSRSGFASERIDWVDGPSVQPVVGVGAGPEKLSFPPTLATSLGNAERLTFPPRLASSMRSSEKPAAAPRLEYSSEYAPEIEGYGLPEGLFEEGSDAGPAPSRFYSSAEYLMWWTKSGRIPALATTSANLNDLGALLPGNTTQVLFGDEVDHNMQSGARFRVGYWFDTPNPLAIEGSFFFLAHRSDGFSTPFSDRLLARPFFDLNNRVESSEIVAFPGQIAGRIAIDSPSSLYGYDANLRCRVCCTDQCWGHVTVDALAGFRFLNLDEGLHIREEGAELVPQRNPDGSLVQDVAFRIDDRFDTKNRFYGGQVGLAAEWKRGKWSVDGRGTVALGVTHQQIDVNGSAFFLNRNGTTSRATGGLLAEGSNIGHFTRNRFSVVPEASVSVGYQVTDWLKASVGYSGLFWSNVVRPGDQIDRGIDIRQIPRFVRPGDPPTPAPLRAGPLVPFRESTYWAQGLTFGLEFKY